ncbi:MAG TPA: hypothetical protein VLW50_09495 [Streptosporangiaceae bacterium]|nr:hypothetical protein [Streptosporangiaceae bacterium]
MEGGAPTERPVMFDARDRKSGRRGNPPAGPRVVAAKHLGGYGGGLALKRLLLRLEGALAEQLSLLGDHWGV